MCFIKETVIAFNLSKPKHKEGLCIQIILNHLKLMHCDVIWEIIPYHITELLSIVLFCSYLYFTTFQPFVSPICGEKPTMWIFCDFKIRYMRFEIISKSLHPIIFGSQVVKSIQGIAAKSDFDRDFVSLKYISSLAFCGSLIGALGAETSRSKCSTMRWSLTISSIWGSWRRFISAFWLQTTN